MADSETIEPAHSVTDTHRLPGNAISSVKIILDKGNWMKASDVILFRKRGKLCKCKFKAELLLLK